MLLPHWRNGASFTTSWIANLAQFARSSDFWNFYTKHVHSHSLPRVVQKVLLSISQDLVQHADLDLIR